MSRWNDETITMARAMAERDLNRLYGRSSRQRCEAIVALADTALAARRELEESERVEHLLRVIRARRKETEKRLRAERDRDEARQIALEVLRQSCGTDDGRLDSMASSTYADAISTMARWGLVEILSRKGRRIFARVRKEG